MSTHQHSREYILLAAAHATGASIAVASGDFPVAAVEAAIAGIYLKIALRPGGPPPSAADTPE